MNNEDEGIILESSSNNTIYGNKILNNKDGLSLSWRSENNNITINIISNNRYGIWLVISSNNNIIYSNNISDNNCGLYLSGSSYNQVTFNNFRENKIDSFFVNCNKDSWDKNYWNRARIFPKPIFGIMKKWGLWIRKIPEPGTSSRSNARRVQPQPRRAQGKCHREVPCGHVPDR